MYCSANNASAAGAARAADTSFDSVVSRESNRSDVVRIRVPFNKEDAVNAKKNAGGSDRNRIRISVSATTPSSAEKRRSAGHNNSVSSNTESSLSSSAGGSTKRHSYNSQTYTSQSLGRQQSSSKSKSDKLSTSLEGASVSVSRYEKYERFEQSSSTSTTTKSTKRTLAASNTTPLTHHQ